MAFRSQSVCNLNQRDVPVLIDPAQHPSRMDLGPVGVPIAANRIRLNAACALVALMPAHRRGNGNIKPGRRRR